MTPWGTYCTPYLIPNRSKLSAACASPLPPQVLGRNLEAVVNRSMDLIKKWGDTYVSVEHLVSVNV